MYCTDFKITALLSLSLAKKNFLLFCSEENVWKLCEFVKTERPASLEQLFVVFISNENRMVRIGSCWDKNIQISNSYC